MKIELEIITNCPICMSMNTAKEIDNVQDSSFNNVSGSWTYYKCRTCSSLYLNPRPTPKSISVAYADYYTHKSHAVTKENRYLSYLKKIKNIVYPYRPSFLKDIYPLKSGLLLDIGCGDGKLMSIAESEGWITKGIEYDSLAVHACLEKGLNVLQGDFSCLREDELFDLIICSHVIEHVHEPLKLIDTALSRLTSTGVFWVQWPNPNSYGFEKYGKYWRGLEAPRHIMLPTISSITDYIMDKYPGAFCVSDKSINWRSTAIGMNAESHSMSQGKGLKISPSSFAMHVLSHMLSSALKPIPSNRCEVCTLVITRQESVR